MTQQEVTIDARRRLAAAFGPRLRGVLLFGSRARGSSRPDSDMDLMVLLDGPVRLGLDIRASVDAIYPIQLNVEFPIHPQPVDAADFAAQEYALYREVKKEGVLL